MFNMGLETKIMLVVGLAVVTLVTLMYFKYEHAIEQNVLLEEKIAAQEAIITEVQQQMVRMREQGKQVADLNKKVITVERQVQFHEDAISAKFTKGGRDFGRLAMGNPDWIGNIITDATNERFRCLEIATGAKTNEKDSANSLCPNLVTTTTR